MLSWKHSFSADASVRVETIPGAVRIGRYSIRCPLVLELLKWDGVERDRPAPPLWRNVRVWAGLVALVQLVVYALFG